MAKTARPLIIPLGVGEPVLFPTYITCESVLDQLNLNKTKRIYKSFGEEKFIKGRCTNNFISALHESYDKHLPFEFSPDSLWLVILMSFSSVINSKSEDFRDTLVCHKGKAVLEVKCDHFIPEDQNLPWGDVTSSFVSKIKQKIKDKDLVKALDTEFSTTGMPEMIAFQMTIMNTFKNYFHYHFRTLCGIPEIHLKGTIEDYTKIKEKISTFSKYDLSDWVSKMTVVLDNIISTFNSPNPEFWENIFKSGNAMGSGGGPYISGWITQFILSGNYNMHCKVIMESDMSTGLCCTPVVWEVGLGSSLQVYNMDMITGFVGITFEEQIVAPKIGWIVVEKPSNVTDLAVEFLKSFSYSPTMPICAVRPEVKDFMIQNGMPVGHEQVSAFIDTIDQVKLSKTIFDMRL